LLTVVGGISKQAWVDVILAQDRRWMRVVVLAVPFQLVHFVVRVKLIKDAVMT
jgi:hypothetical protein